MEKVVEWLEQMFIKDNHPKYRHLYKEWSKNLTDSQLSGFLHQMERLSKRSAL